MTFKVGDKVKLNQPYGGRPIGTTGTVDAAPDEDGLIGVVMDDRRYPYMLVYAYRVDLIVAETPKAAPDLPVDAVKLVVQSADRIFPRRSYDTIFKSLMEEMGELATEIAVEQGTKKRDPSPDGIKGEAVDVFIVAVDMLRTAWGDELFTSAFTDKVASKLAKWEGK